MKASNRIVAEIARITKSLDDEGLGNTFHFYLRDGKNLIWYEDPSGLEYYPDEDGEYLLSTTRPLTQNMVREIIRAWS